MNKRTRAKQIADAIKDIYKIDKVVICWNINQAKRYGLLKMPPKTIGFACVFKMDSAEVTAVVPIAKCVIFNTEHDFMADILGTIGRYLINHFEIEMMAEEMKPHYEVIEMAQG